MVREREGGDLRKGGIAGAHPACANGARLPSAYPHRALFAAGACLLAIGGATTTGLLHEQLTPPPARAEPSLPRVRQPRWDKRKYSYVIIGSGTTASAAIESILLMQPDAKILLIAREQSSVPSDVLGPFEKGELQLGGDLLHSFNEWRRHITSRFINDSPHGTGPVDVIHQNNLTIDVEGHRVSLGEDCSGGYVFYDKCLVATTGKPRKLYVLDSERSRQQLTDSINTLHDLEDFEVLETLMDEEKIKHVTVIGGGFLGSEVALALAKRGAAKNVEVSQVGALGLQQCKSDTDCDLSPHVPPPACPQTRRFMQSSAPCNASCRLTWLSTCVLSWTRPECLPSRSAL
jgi:hypothetical protein